MRRGLATWIGGLLLAAGALATVAGAAEAWVAVTRETHPGLPGNEIQFLSPARDGGVWVGTLSGLGRLTGNECSTVVEKIEAWCVLEAGDGGLWVGHHNGVLRRTAEGKTTAALAGHTVSPIVEIRPGVLWALAKERATETNRLMAWAGKEWTPVPGSEKLRAVDLFQSRKGQLWVSVDGNGVLEVGADGDLAQARHHHRGLNVSTVAEDGHGRIWCGFWSRGAAVWDGATWGNHIGDERTSAILTICEDRSQTLWAATSANGVWRRAFNRQEWTHDLADEGAVNLLAATPDGRVWVSSQMHGGLRYWDGEAWQVSLDSPLPIRCILQTADGRTVAGGVLDGLHVREGK